MEAKISASFTLTKFECEPEKITQILEIHPTETWKIGDLIGETSLKREFNGWVLESCLDTSADLEAHIKNVLEQLKPSWEKLRELGLQYYAEISCVIYSYEGQSPAISFDKEILKATGELNAEIDVDFNYVYTPE